jgi:hypothetical protein
MCEWRRPPAPGSYRDLWRRTDKQLSLRSEQVPEVRRWLDDYHNLKEAIEAICAVNQELLRANREALKARSMGDD